MDIGSALAAANQAIVIAKGLRAQEKAYDQALMKGQLIDLMDKLLEVRETLQDSREEILGKDQVIADLKKLLDRREDTVLVNGFRYTPDPEDSSKPVGSPYCLRCDEIDHRLIRTVDNSKGRGVVCPQCKSEYGRGATQYLWPEQRAVVSAYSPTIPAKSAA